MCLHLYQPELGLAGWLTGYTKDLFHRVTAKSQTLFRGTAFTTQQGRA